MAHTSGSWRFSHSSLVIVKLGTCTQHAHTVVWPSHNDPSNMVRPKGCTRPCASAPADLPCLGTSRMCVCLFVCQSRLCSPLCTQEPLTAQQLLALTLCHTTTAVLRVKAHTQTQNRASGISNDSGLPAVGCCTRPSILGLRSHVCCAVAGAHVAQLRTGPPTFAGRSTLSCASSTTIPCCWPLTPTPRTQAAST